jgi:uncharacterized OB-fold protein
MEYVKPLPHIDPLSEPFWEMTREGKLGVHVCAECHNAHYPGTPVCPKCLSSDQFWQASSGRGRLMSWCTFHRAYWESFAPDLPFTIGLVQIQEGPLLAFTLVDFNPAELRLEMPVETVFEPVTAKLTLPRFRPVARNCASAGR